MKKTIIFLSEMPITNGVIQSQMLPIVFEARKKGFEAEIIETVGRFDSQEKTRKAVADKLKSAGVKLEKTKIPRHTILPSIIYFTLGTYGLIKKQAGKRKAQSLMIYARNYKFAPVLILAKHFWNIPYIYSPRGAYVAERKFYRKAKDVLYASLVGYFEKKAIIGSEKTIVETDGFKEHLKKLYSLDDSRFEVIPNCYDASLLPKEDWNREEMREKLGFSGKKVIAYAGTVEVWYEFERMIDLVSRLRKRDSEIFFQLFLKEDYARTESSGMMHEIEKLMEKYGLQKGIGYSVSSYPPSERYSYLSACDAGICLSVPEEFKAMMLYLKIVDFIGAKLPIIANKEMIEAKKIVDQTGVGAIVDYDDWDDSISKINLEKLSRKEEAASFELKKYSSEKVVPQYLELFENIL